MVAQAGLEVLQLQTEPLEVVGLEDILVLVGLELLLFAVSQQPDTLVLAAVAVVVGLGTVEMAVVVAESATTLRQMLLADVAALQRMDLVLVMAVLAEPMAIPVGSTAVVPLPHKIPAVMVVVMGVAEVEPTAAALLTKQAVVAL